MQMHCKSNANAPDKERQARAVEPLFFTGTAIKTAIPTTSTPDLL